MEEARLFARAGLSLPRSLRPPMQPPPAEARALDRPRFSVCWLDIAMDLAAAATPGAHSPLPPLESAAASLDRLVTSLGIAHGQGDMGEMMSRRSSSFSFGDMAGEHLLAEPPHPPATMTMMMMMPAPKAPAAPLVSTANLATDVPELSPASEAPDDAFFPPDCPPPSSQALLQSPSAREGRKAKVYSCQLCTKTYGTSEGLRLHIRAKHTNDKSSKCPHCERSFVRVSDLKLHVLRMHEASRPFACIHCAKTFACKSELRRHLSMHERLMKRSAESSS